jgi:CDP-6-deoxy-D-xylo-4-hexulose-3-dehydrase
MGGMYNGKPLGTWGLFGTFSTYYSHHLCTMEGGLVVTNDLEFYHFMLCIRSHGWTRHLPSDSPVYRKGEDPFYESFNFIVPGFNLRPLEMEGALGTAQLKKLDRIIAQRRANAACFRDALRDIPGIRLQKECGESAWFGFAVVLEGGRRGARDSVVRALAHAEIEARPIVAGNFTRNPVIQYLAHEIVGDLRAADDVHENGFFVGNHSKDMTEELEHFRQVLANAIRES